MFLKRKMNNSTNSYSDKILQIKDKIGEADAIIIGAGAGLSTSAGFLETMVHICRQYKIILLFHQIIQVLISCYESCLRIADENEVTSIAFCCISTGVFMFPNKRAAELAVQTVKQYKEKTKSKIKVIFNVFKEEDEQLYKQLLG